MSVRNFSSNSVKSSVLPKNCPSCTPLMSLYVKPPPIRVLEKWWKFLGTPSTPFIHSTTRDSLLTIPNLIKSKPLNHLAASFFPGNTGVIKSLVSMVAPANPYSSCLLKTPATPTSYADAVKKALSRTPGVSDSFLVRSQQRMEMAQGKSGDHVNASI